MNLGYKMSRWLFNTFDDSRQEFYEDFASALRDGSSERDRLNKMATRARQRRTGWAPLYEHWLLKMRRMSFASALQHTVPDYEVMVLTAAEADKRLSDAMDYLSRALRFSSKAKSAYFMALISPLMSLLTLLGFFLAYALVIAPQNLQTLPLERWPQVSRQLYAFSNLLVDGGISLCIGMAMLVWLVLWSRSQWRGKARAMIDRVPFLPWRSYREREANTFLITFAILLQSNNYGPREALERMRQFASPWLSWHLGTMLVRLKLTPDLPARALNTGLFPQGLMDRIEDYSERSEFTKALHSLAFDHGDKQVQAAEKRAVVGGFIFMGLVAAVIGLIVWANLEFNQALEAYVQTIR